MGQTTVERNQSESSVQNEEKSEGSDSEESVYSFDDILEKQNSNQQASEEINNDEICENEEFIVENNREMTDSVVKKKKKKVRSKKVEKEDESENLKISENFPETSKCNQEIEDKENQSDQEKIKNEPDLIFDQTLDLPENE